jgi:mannose-6-phosphate isomerase-like protein (cupin superfamily)
MHDRSQRQAPPSTLDMENDMPDTTITAEQLRARVIRRADLKADAEAFVDVRVPGSTPKYNYQLIGAGVSQNPDAFINLREPHGFGLGGASMPHGVTNNLHMHFTAEVFICWAGTWRLRWGPAGEQGEMTFGEGDVATIPPWIFRGFSNLGGDDAYLYTMLGRDVTGGVVWAPSILEKARETGLVISRNNTLIDLRKTPDVQADKIMPPMAEAQIKRLRCYTPEEMARRIVKHDALQWNARPLLDSMLPGGAKEMAPVIGFGLTEERDMTPPVVNPHGFTLEWMRAMADNGLLEHRHANIQAVLVKSGDWQLTVNRDADAHTVAVEPGTVLSIPADVWRSLRCVRGPGEVLLITGSESRTRIEWCADVRQSAQEAGWAIDPDGYIAPTEVLALAAA